MPNPHPTPSAEEMTATEYLELARKATQGPWEWDNGIIPPDGPGNYADIYTDAGETIIAGFNDQIPCGMDNARFIVAARNESPRIIAGLVGERDLAIADNAALAKHASLKIGEVMINLEYFKDAVGGALACPSCKASAHKTNEIKHLSTCFYVQKHPGQALLDEIAGLRRVVERLQADADKTADGQEIVSGQSVYCESAAGLVEVIVDRRGPRWASRHATIPGRPCGTVGLSECFSSREAAEQALAQRAGAGREGEDNGERP